MTLGLSLLLTIVVDRIIVPILYPSLYLYPLSSDFLGQSDHDR